MFFDQAGLAALAGRTGQLLAMSHNIYYVKFYYIFKYQLVGLITTAWASILSRPR